VLRIRSLQKNASQADRKRNTPGRRPALTVIVNFTTRNNHLQDEPPLPAGRVSCWRRVTRPVSAGWSSRRVRIRLATVQALALENKIVLPSFGYHPWYLGERTPDWQSSLRNF